MLNTLNLESIALAKDFVLADVGVNVGGMALKYLIVVDAFLVLSGAVLASFVGASGLLYRMTLDQCFPSKILLPKLKKRNQNANRIIIAFALLCLSILFVTGGSLLSLAGVYTISFLGVMSLFAHHPAKLFKSLEYIRKNETSRNITVVFCTKDAKDSKLFTAQFISYIKTFKTANIFPMFKIEFVLEDKLEFEPETVRTYSKRYRIGRNNIFIGSIHEQHGFTFEDLGGVRIIQ